MKLLFTALLSGLISGLSLFSIAADLPARIDISYSMKASGLSAEVNDTLEIKRVNGVRNYAITSEARATGLLALLQRGHIVRTSQGVITDAGLQPLRFSDQRDNKPYAVAIFDWAKKLLTLQHEGNETQKPLSANSQDRVSLLYTFIFFPPTGKTVELYETDGRGLSLFRYAVAGKETLDTPMGKLETVVLVKQQEKDDLRGRKLWFATAHHMLPVRTLATEKDGSMLDQMVTKISYAESR